MGMANSSSGEMPDGASENSRGLTGVDSNFQMSPAEHENHQFRESTVFPLFCNATIYGFFRASQILYDRLVDVNGTEGQMRADVERRKNVKAASEYGNMTYRIEDIFSDTSPTANYYGQILDMCSKVLKGELDADCFEESLWSVNLQQGWKLFTVKQTCNAILKYLQCMVPSGGKRNGEKEKTAAIIVRFQKDRDNRGYYVEGGTSSELIAYRRAVEDILGETDDLCRIDWVRVQSLSMTRRRKTDGWNSTRPRRRLPFA